MGDRPYVALHPDVEQTDPGVFLQQTHPSIRTPATNGIRGLPGADRRFPGNQDLSTSFSFVEPTNLADCPDRGLSPNPHSERETEIRVG
jgi:hypothetical protein